MKPYKYAFWNNKGGVGKTFLCFAVASEYALQHLDVQVVVIDMCPQANLSEILLGGNGDGGKKLQDLIDKKDNPQTIGGYYHQRILQPHEKTKTEKDFLIQVKEFNEKSPDNLYLIAGDPSLELQVQTINNIAVQDIPKGAWQTVHSWVKDLQDSAVSQFSGRKCAFFIDCNPSFSSYTEQALLAVDRLIVPCTPDGSSARAISNVGQLVYGHGVHSNYEEASFSHKAKKKFFMTLPKIHLVAMNRSTTYRKKPAKAFNKMYENIKDRVRKQMSSLPDNFTSADEDVFIDIPDAHTVAIVASDHGKPIRNLRVGKYNLGGKSTQLNKSSLDLYKQAIQKLVSLL